MRYPFSAIRQSTVPEEIVTQIKDLIRDGELKPGEKLPSERQLSRMLGVGRSSLREAINSLSMMGLVEVKRRKGAYVGTVSSPLISNPLRQLMDDKPKTFADLYDIRIDIEVASAMAAAENRTDKQLAIIAGSLEEMKNNREAAYFATDNDLQFHLTIAVASDNFIRAHIVKEIFDLAGDHIHIGLKKLTAHRKNIDAVYNQHRAIYKAIFEKNPTRAGSAMLTHLGWIKSQLNTFLEK